MSGVDGNTGLHILLVLLFIILGVVLTLRARKGKDQ